MRKSKHSPGTPSHESQKIGIMADSHGQPDAIKKALTRLEQEDCRQVYHLGDICDSSHPETADACVRLLQKRGVLAIKGNNDHRVVIDHLHASRAYISGETIDYLRSLPQMLKCDGAIGAHSLPFPDDLGPACMIWAMKDNDIRRFFLEFPHDLLFRGHDHSPWIAWQNDNDIITRPISTGEELTLKDRFPYVITCGALTRGLCMVWHMEKMSLACLSIHNAV